MQGSYTLVKVRRQLIECSKPRYRRRNSLFAIVNELLHNKAQYIKINKQFGYNQEDKTYGDN